MGRILAILVVGGLAVGCTRNVVKNKTPSDPLLVSKKPVEGKPRPAPTDPLLHAEGPAYPGTEFTTTSGQRSVIPPAPPPPSWPGGSGDNLRAGPP
jgi:hypothetical protein